MFESRQISLSSSRQIAASVQFAIVLFFFLVAAVILSVGGTRAFAQTPLSTVVANHYLVAYRDGNIPQDADSSTSLAGGRIIKRHASLGMVMVQTNGTANDAANLKHLASQANVDFVVHDRMVQAHRVVTSTDAKVKAQTATAAPGKALVTVSMANLAQAQSKADSFYAEPQGWAVRQVGGYGKGVAGGATTGPWDVTMGEGARIAILDSGVDQKHPDIAPNLVYNASMVDHTPMSGLPSACDDGTPQDQQGHGTWAASLAAGAAGAASGKVIGVAPSASILNIKVLERMPNTGVAGTVAQQCAAGQASGLLSWVIAGINEAVKQHADVISLSLGSMVDLSTGDGAGLKAIFDRATYAAAQAGTVIIAAAGNDGFDFSNPRYIELPAMARSVVAIVASTNPDCMENISAGATCVAGPVSLPYYSNLGAPMNALSAPGGNLPAGGDAAVSGWVRGACSASGCFNLGDAQYVQAMGTSAAAPLAAGVAALIHAAHKNWDAATVVATLRQSAKVTATMPYGQVNAAVALGLAK